MTSTGVESLDARLGALRRGGLYVFLGAAASGKSLLSLHFLIDGLAHGERCVLITGEQPAMIDGRAACLGHRVGRLSEHPGLRIVAWPDGLAAGRAITAVSPGKASGGLGEWLTGTIRREAPSRIVVDGITSLIEQSGASRVQFAELVRALDSTRATIYMLVRAEPHGGMDGRYEPLMTRADAAFTLDVSETGQRMFAFRKAPAGAYRTEPFAYSLRTGAGFTEELTLHAVDVSPEERQRVVVVDEYGLLAPDVLAGLEQMYDLDLRRTATGALGTLSAGRYGALVLAVDPFDETRAFDLIFAIRKEGNGAPIVCAAPSRGLRSTTRSRGLRAGADDFFVADLPSAEVLERIQMAWLRGRRQRTGLRQIGPIIQPLNDAGLARPMTRREFLEVMATLVAEQPPLFFCYLEFALTESTPERVWPFLRGRVRIGEGDVIGVLGDGRFGCALDLITPGQTERVVDRIRAAHPTLASLDDVVILASPGQADRIRERLLAPAGGSGTAERDAAAG